jgi:hypothetical protein
VRQSFRPMNEQRREVSAGHTQSSPTGGNDRVSKKRPLARRWRMILIATGSGKHRGVIARTSQWWPMTWCQHPQAIPGT